MSLSGRPANRCAAGSANSLFCRAKVLSPETHPVKRHCPGRAAQFLYALLPLLLVALSCFPLAKITANSTVTLVSSGPRSKPFVNVETAHRLELTYTGDARAVAALQA